ncbi:uncharacterized protein LOC129285605 [Prosopis cineraria]|uniref:uncharacterized protein LOC129285605 n=1 Tax=Prosopis cineraria TaxID=364024 RepID=UPI0024108B28|nr:uncharacterized protein LOC129285605 [Prosopis cineraria]
MAYAHCVAAVAFCVMYHGLGAMRRDLLSKINNKNETRWNIPSTRWAKLDVDGSTNFNGIAACGGLIRDDKGNWIKNFSKNLGYQPKIAAEHLGIMEGLNLCWNAKLTRVNVYSNFVEALSLIDCNFIDSHPLSAIITNIKNIIMQD